METNITKIGVFTSGGDSPGMNAAIRAVVRAGLFYKLQVIGIRRGYEGMIEGDFYEMGSQSVSNIIQRGGTILKSARSEEFRTKKGRKQAYEQLKSAGIEGVVAIGGDGTFTGAKIFYEEYGIPFIGVPGTIDNDLYGTDYTIGYDTALNTAVEAIDMIRDTAASHDRLFFIEVMGRDAGFIALRSGIAGGAEAVLIPETKTDSAHLFNILEKKWAHEKSSMIVVVAEGDETGGAIKIADKVRGQYPDYDIRVTVLGHLQRGGSPTCMDRILASRLGVAAVKGLVNGETNVMAGQLHRDVHYIPFEKAIKHHKDINYELLELVEMLT